MKGITIGQPIVNTSVDNNYKILPDIDAKYGPYNSLKDALTILTNNIRAIGLTVGIKLENNTISEYWFNGGISDENLIFKQLNDKNIKTIAIQDTAPANVDALWLDTSEPNIEDIANEELAPIIESIQAIQNYINTIVKQRDLIINPGHVSNTFTDSALNSSDPINPTPEKVNIIFKNIRKSFAPETDEYEPNTKAVRAHYGTLAEIQGQFQKFVDYELLLATDVKRLYTKINGEPVNLTGSSSGGGGGGSIDYEALDKLDTIGFIDSNKQIWRIKVNTNGQLVVYKKELDTAHAEPSGGQEDPNTGWIYVTTLYLQKLYINSLYCGGLSSDEYSYNPCSHNFVELSNLTDNDISLNGLSLQYGTEGGNWEVLPLWGNIKAGSTFLIRGAQCSILNINTTRIKVNTYDMEWIASTNKLIKFDNRKAKFFLTWGKTPSSVTNPFNSTTSPIRVSKGYIDLVGLQIKNAGDADKVDAAEITSYNYLSSSYLFTKYFTMDSVSQATKALSARNNSADMYFVNLEKDIIPNVESYTPRASFENKTLFFNKTLLDPNKPNKVTMTLGRNGTAPNATRCFNWVSVGYYDECIYYRKVNIETPNMWNVEGSFNKETGIRKYYNRIRAITTDGTAFTTHKIIIKNLSEGLYEYYIGRFSDDVYKSDVRNFSINNYTNSSSWKFLQTSDQQGFNRDEYNVWKIAARYLSNNYINSGEIEFMINTGDMTQNGNRINEWLDYEDGRSLLFDIPEMVTVGNNDLTPANVYILGDGGDNSKINASNIRFFYCFEMDETNPPIFTIEGKEIFIESLYSFNFGDTHFLCVNSEISANTERDVYGLTTQKVIYEHIKQWCIRDIERIPETNKFKIAYCHEMPFTIITQDLINSFYWAGVETKSVERSGSRLNFNTSPENAYWFGKFLYQNEYKLCLGGHKHTYSCSYPLIEGDKHSMKPIIQVTNDLLLSNFGSTELYTETTEGNLKGQSFPKKWQNNANYDMLKHLCTFVLVDKITAPTYIMCQATGYKHTSNKELPTPNTPWLRYFYPASITINGKNDIVAKVNAGQRYPFYIIYDVSTNAVEARVKKLANVFDSSGKYNINIEGVAPSATEIGGNGQTNNGNDIIIIQK